MEQYGIIIIDGRTIEDSLPKYITTKYHSTPFLAQPGSKLENSRVDSGD